MGKGPATGELYGRDPVRSPSLGLFERPNTTNLGGGASQPSSGKGPSSSGKGPSSQVKPFFSDLPGYSQGGSFWGNFGSAVDAQRAHREYEAAEAKRRAEEEALARLKALQNSAREYGDGSQHGDR